MRFPSVQPSSTSRVVVLLFVLGVANIAIDFAFVRDAKKLAAMRHPPVSHYSLIEDDYPPHLPLVNYRSSIGSYLEESVRYGLREPETTLEWAYTGAVGDGNIRLGPNHRFFNTGFSYQLHCARFIVSAFQKEDPPTGQGEIAHVSRCLNVLRQFALCSADTTLEPAESMTRNFTAARFGGRRKCRDWPALYETMERNWADWNMFRQTLDA